MTRIDKCKGKGRTLIVRFKCTRCEKEKYEELETCIKRSGEIECHLEKLKLPEGWIEETIGRVVLCDDCRNEYMEFLATKDTFRKKST